jgi:hypothetical protein
VPGRVRPRTERAWGLRVTPLDFAHLPEVRTPLYGFSPDRPGGPHGVDLPFQIRKTPHTNCVAFAMSYLARVSPKPCPLSVWQVGMLSTQDRRGPCQAAVDLGLAVDSCELEPGDHLEPGWYVAQGWRANGSGHAVFLHVLPSARPAQVLVLEARGKNTGGAYKGQDGVSSRCCSPPNVRDWPEGKWGEVSDVWTVERLLGEFPECYAARLEVS